MSAASAPPLSTSCQTRKHASFVQAIDGYSPPTLSSLTATVSDSSALPVLSGSPPVCSSGIDERHAHALDRVLLVALEGVGDEEVRARDGDARRAHLRRLALVGRVVGGARLGPLRHELGVEAPEEDVVAVLGGAGLPGHPEAAAVGRALDRRPVEARLRRADADAHPADAPVGVEPAHLHARLAAALVPEEEDDAIAGREERRAHRVVGLRASGRAGADVGRPAASISTE